MTKKHWAWVLILFGVAIVYGNKKLLSGNLDLSTTAGKIENDLAQLSAAFGTDTPWPGYAAIGVGAWLLYG